MQIKQPVLFVLVAFTLSIIFSLNYFQTQNKAETIKKIIIAEAGQPIGGLVYIALNKGYFKDEGLNVILQPHKSGKSSLQAVLDGNADLATTAETPIMHATMKNQSVLTIATIGNSDRNMAVIARKDLGISTPKQLKGKKIGFTQGTNGEFFLDMFLLSHYIAYDDIIPVHIKPKQISSALITNQVDAVSIWNPHIAFLQKTLGEKASFFYGEDIYTWTWNIAGLSSYINQYPDTIEKILRALNKAEAFNRNHTKQAQIIVASYLQSDITDLQKIWPILNLSVSLSQALLTTIEDQARWSINKGVYANKKMPNFYDSMYIDGMKAVKPNAMTIIQ